MRETATAQRNCPALVAQGFTVPPKEDTIVLAAYLDASDPKPGVPVAVVAGFLASTEEWARFESLWKPFLKEFGIARFHATEYFARRGQFQNWSDAKHLAAQGEVCRILKGIRPIGVGTALDTRAFDEWRASSDTFFPSDPYYLCVERTIYKLVHSISENPNDEGIAIYCDQDKGHETLARDIATWHEERLRRTNNPVRMDPNRPVSIHYVSSFDFVPVQAADILSHGMFQWMRSYVTTGKVAVVPPFLECLKIQEGETFVSMNFLTTKESIGASLKARLD
jgi:hypothetical protein